MHRVGPPLPQNLRAVLLLLPNYSRTIAQVYSFDSALLVRLWWELDLKGYEHFRRPRHSEHSHSASSLLSTIVAKNFLCQSNSEVGSRASSILRYDYTS